MGRYLSDLAERIKRGSGAPSSDLFIAEYVSPTAIKVGGETFCHGIATNPDLLLNCTTCGKKAAKAGDIVLVVGIGAQFYVICKV